MNQRKAADARRDGKATTSDTDVLQHVNRDLHRPACARAAQQAVAAVQQYNVERLPVSDSEIDESGPTLMYNAGHSGSAPTEPDSVARRAAWKVMRQGLRQQGVGNDAIIEAGEEAGNPTRAVSRGDYVVRLDALDGTSLAETRWDGFCSVALLDQVRNPARGAESVRHLAGAICCSTGWTVSWAQWSSYDRTLGRYRRLAGAVYLSNEPWGIAEREVTDRRWTRRAGTVAAVAASSPKLEKLAATLTAVGIPTPDSLFTLAGNPLAPALIGGLIDCVVEPGAVSLHDSALLIPHQLLGGLVTATDLGAFDYLGAYETHGLDLAVGAKPVAGYIAWGDTAASASAVLAS